MTLAETLIALRRCGVRRLRFDMKKQRILFNAKPGAVSPELGEALTRHKAAILALMRRGVTRPTIADLEAAEAEAPDLPLRRPMNVDDVRVAALLPLPGAPPLPSVVDSCSLAVDCIRRSRGEAAMRQALEDVRARRGDAIAAEVEARLKEDDHATE